MKKHKGNRNPPLEDYSSNCPQEDAVMNAKVSWRNFKKLDICIVLKYLYLKIFIK